MSASGRRPTRNEGSPTSRRAPGPARTSGRTRPDGGGDDPTAFKKVMFYGTGVLIVVCLVLVVVRWDTLTQKPPAKQRPAPVKREDLELQAIDKQAQQARKQFNDAERLTDGAAKAKGIQGAIDALAAARDKLADMMERPQYKGEEYDAVFGPKLDKMQQEIKTYREAKARAMSGR